MSRPEFVPVETVDVGDKVRLSWLHGDIETSVTGRVADIQYAGKDRILISEHGLEIGRYDVSAPRKTVCEMITRYNIMQPALFQG